MEQLILRQAAIDALSELATFTDEWSEHTWMYTDDVYKTIKQLQSTQPEHIKWHWIAMEKKNLFRCSECGAVIYSESEYDRNEFHKFCGRCGAEMGQKGENNESN